MIIVDNGGPSPGLPAKFCSWPLDAIGAPLAIFGAPIISPLFFRFFLRGFVAFVGLRRGSC